MAEAEQTVKQAVYALYSADAVQQAQANQWLTAFQQSNEAWQVSFRLISRDQPQELLFFAATLLVRKVKADWGRLEPPLRQELGQATRAKFQEVLSWPAVPPLVLRQLCLLLATVVGSSGGEGTDDIISQAKALLGSPSTQLGLELLTALGEECEDLDRVRRQALVGVLLPRAREVFGWLGQLLATALEQVPGEWLGDSGAAHLAAASLRCTEAWLKLNQVAGGGSILTPGEIHAQQPQLFSGILSALVGRQRPPQVIDAAVEVLLLVFGADTFTGNNEDAERAATAATLDALLALRHRLGPGAEAEGAAAGVAQLGSALAERAPEWLCGQLPQAVPFSELMLECLSLPNPAAPENSLEYFLMINTVPLAERAPPLGGVLYEAMLRALVPHVSLPQHFTSWEEEGEVDQDAFDRLRDQMLPESLETAYGLLRARYLGFAWHLLQTAPSWQQAEAAMYLFNAVSISVKASVLSAGSPAGGGADENSPAGASAAAQQDAQQAKQLLASLFAQLCSPEGIARLAAPGAHPLLARGACSLVEGYAAWFARAQEVPLQEALRLCLACMHSPVSSGVASKAFQALCVRCAWRLRDPHLVASLIDAASPLLQPQQAPAHQHPPGALQLQQAQQQQQQHTVFSMADKQALVEGLARLVAGLPPPNLQEAAARLTRPFTAHATSLVQAFHQQQQQQQSSSGHHQGHALANGHVNGSGSPSPVVGTAAGGPSTQACQALAEDLQLVAGALRFLAFGSALGQGSGGGSGDSDAGSLQPVVRVLQEVGPMLQAVVDTPGWYCHEGVATAAAEVYRRAICSARKQGAELLPAVVPMLVLLFERALLPACLDALGDVVEIHFQEGPDTRDALERALAAACVAAFPRLQADLREQQYVASSLLSLADQFCVYLPALLWASPLLGPLLQLSAACVSLREADPVSHALALLGRCLGAHEREDEDGTLLQAHVDAVDAALLGHGEELLRSLLAAECDTCPRHLMRSAADCIYRLLTHTTVGERAQGWLSAVLASGQLPGVASGQLTGEDCSVFAGIALGGAVRGARFAALCMDFGLLARGQNTSDVLLAYQM
ncbi:hypothetical protein N2152v2_005815 [Parachlorella kessleri]